MKGTRWRKVIRQCTSEIYREFRISSTVYKRPDKWVFLVGCYNSGTTLLRKVLGSNPLISALPSEGQYLTDQLPSDHEIGLSRMWVKREDLYRLTEIDEGPDVDRIKKEWGMRLDKSRPLYLDQTPANAARTRWLQKNFENAYFIGIIRNGYAVAEGISRKARPIHKHDGWSVEQAAYQWSRSNEVLLSDAEHLKHIIWVRYEDFTENPEKEILRILKFLEIETGDGVDINQAWSVHERDQKIKNMNKLSIDRLSLENISSINKVADDMLVRLGYPVLPSD